MYAHDDSENMEDSFTVQLTDGQHQLHRQVMVKVLPVNDQEPRITRLNRCQQLHSLYRKKWQIKCVTPRNKKNKITVFLIFVSFRNNGLEVEPGESRLISSVTLLAQDADTPSSEVKYIFESVPTQGLLQLKVGAFFFCFCVYKYRGSSVNIAHRFVLSLYKVRSSWRTVGKQSQLVPSRSVMYYILKRSLNPTIQFILNKQLICEQVLH